jgi:hypothetical protein
MVSCRLNKKISQIHLFISYKPGIPNSQSNGWFYNDCREIDDPKWHCSILDQVMKEKPDKVMSSYFSWEIENLLFKIFQIDTCDRFSFEFCSER